MKTYYVFPFKLVKASKQSIVWIFLFFNIFSGVFFFSFFGIIALIIYATNMNLTSGYFKCHRIITIIWKIFLYIGMVFLIILLISMIFFRFEYSSNENKENTANTTWYLLNYEILVVAIFMVFYFLGAGFIINLIN